jgi:hypothetical protein
MQYNDPVDERAPDGTPARGDYEGDTAEFPTLRMASNSGARDGGKPDPRLADQSPLDYSRGPHSRPLDVDDHDED